MTNCSIALPNVIDREPKSSWLKPRNLSQSFHNSFPYKVALQDALWKGESDTSKKIRIMKSFKRILKSDTKTVIYLKNKAKRKSDNHYEKYRQLKHISFSENLFKNFTISNISSKNLRNAEKLNEGYSNNLKNQETSCSDVESPLSLQSTQPSSSTIGQILSSSNMIVLDPDTNAWDISFSSPVKSMSSVSTKF